MFRTEAPLGRLIERRRRAVVRGAWQDRLAGTVPAAVAQALHRGRDQENVRVADRRSFVLKLLENLHEGRGVQSQQNSCHLAKLEFPLKAVLALRLFTSSPQPLGGSAAWGLRHFGLALDAPTRGGVLAYARVILELVLSTGRRQFSRGIVPGFTALDHGSGAALVAGSPSVARDIVVAGRRPLVIGHWQALTAELPAQVFGDRGV
mmetsp:Transcript_96564/g.223907  ORF Transcript_96564/g.223907 Transcript_96564/m.223907 type:complete len:206 (+) Transcript_96564:91-708(+)